MSRPVSESMQEHAMPPPGYLSKSRPIRRQLILPMPYPPIEAQDTCSLAKPRQLRIAHLFDELDNTLLPFSICDTGAISSDPRWRDTPGQSPLKLRRARNIAPAIFLSLGSQCPVPCPADLGPNRLGAHAPRVEDRRLHFPVPLRRCQCPIKPMCSAAVGFWNLSEDKPINPAPENVIDGGRQITLAVHGYKLSTRSFSPSVAVHTELAQIVANQGLNVPRCKSPWQLSKGVCDLDLLGHWELGELGIESSQALSQIISNVPPAVDLFRPVFDVRLQGRVFSQLLVVLSVYDCTRIELLNKLSRLLIIGNFKRLDGAVGQRNQHVVQPGRGIRQRRATPRAGACCT